MNESQEIINRLSQHFNPLSGVWDIVPTERYVREMVDRSMQHRWSIDHGLSISADSTQVLLPRVEDRTIYIYSVPIDRLEILDIPAYIVDSMIFFRERSTSAINLIAPQVMENYFPENAVDPDHECLVELNFGTATIYRMMKSNFNFLAP